MAKDYSGLNTFPAIKRWTLAGGVDDATKVTLPSPAEKISFRFNTNDGKIAFGGDDAAVVESDHATIPADTWMELTFKGRGGGQAQDHIMLASGTASTVVELMMEDVG